MSTWWLQIPHQVTQVAWWVVAGQSWQMAFPWAPWKTGWAKTAQNECAKGVEMWLAKSNCTRKLTFWAQSSTRTGGCGALPLPGPLCCLPSALINAWFQMTSTPQPVLWVVLSTGSWSWSKITMVKLSSSSVCATFMLTPDSQPWWRYESQSQQNDMFLEPTNPKWSCFQPMPSCDGSDFSHHMLVDTSAVGNTKGPSHCKTSSSSYPVQSPSWTTMSTKHTSIDSIAIHRISSGSWFVTCHNWKIWLSSSYIIPVIGWRISWLCLPKPPAVDTAATQQ